MGQRKKGYIQREGKFLVSTNTCDQKATIGTVKSTLSIPPQHNSVMPIKISGTIIEDHIWHTSSQMTILQREKIQT